MLKIMIKEQFDQLAEELSRLQKEYEQDDALREDIISLARKALKPAKQAIYAAHRDDIPSATQLVTQAKQAIDKAHEQLAKSGLQDVGILNAALEEYIESACYIHFVQTGTIPSIQELQLPTGTKPELYLQGLCDCAGELARRAVRAATKKDETSVKQIYDFLEKLLTEYMKFDFRSSELRKKTENLKYSLNKVEGIWYDLQVKSR